MNRIPRTTMVVVTRYYANNSNMAPITHDPMTIAQAEKKGLTSTDSGTMRFKLEVVGGEFDGCPAGRVNDNWFADTYRRDQAAISEMMAGG